MHYPTKTIYKILYYPLSHNSTLGGVFEQKFDLIKELSPWEATYELHGQGNGYKSKK